MIDTNDLSISSTAVTNRGTANHLSIKDRPSIFHTASVKAKTDIREAAHVFKIMVFLHTAKDFPTRARATHDSQVASHTERMLLLNDGKIAKEKQGLLVTKKKNLCPYCGGKIQPSDIRCPSCNKRL